MSRFSAKHFPIAVRCYPNSDSPACHITANFRMNNTTEFSRHWFNFFRRWTVMGKSGGFPADLTYIRVFRCSIFRWPSAYPFFLSFRRLASMGKEATDHPSERNRMHATSPSSKTNNYFLGKTRRLSDIQRTNERTKKKWCTKGLRKSIFLLE